MLNDIEKKYDKEVSRYLKVELDRRNISYAEVIQKLQTININITYESFVNKINRGTFKVSFLFQIFDALDIKISELANRIPNR